METPGILIGGNNIIFQGFHDYPDELKQKRSGKNIVSFIFLLNL